MLGNRNNTDENRIWSMWINDISP